MRIEGSTSFFHFARQNMPDKPVDFFLKPDDMAASVVWLTPQPRSAWTFEFDVRPSLIGLDPG